MDAVGPEVVVLALFTVGDDRRSGRLELGDGVRDRRLVKRIEIWVGAVSPRSYGVNQGNRARDTANRLGGYACS